jgi:hypothetical protein
MPRLTLRDPNNSSDTRETRPHQPQYERTDLLAGTWIVFLHGGLLTKAQIREYFLTSLGVELCDDRISQSRGKFTCSFDKLMLASLIQWILEGSDAKNPNHIEVAPSRE